MGGPWPINAAIYSRPSAVSLKVWLRETRLHSFQVLGCVQNCPMLLNRALFEGTDIYSVSATIVALLDKRTAIMSV